MLLFLKEHPFIYSASHHHDPFFNTPFFLLLRNFRHTWLKFNITIWLSWWWALYAEEKCPLKIIFRWCLSNTNTSLCTILNIRFCLPHTHARERAHKDSTCEIILVEYPNTMFSLVLFNITRSVWPPTAFIFLDDPIVDGDCCMIYCWFLPFCLCHTARIVQN